MKPSFFSFFCAVGRREGEGGGGYALAAGPEGEDERVDCAAAGGCQCDFVGKPADLGVHRYYKHGLCNPAKAVTLTNRCPGCDNLMLTVPSAKEHARRALKAGKCPTGRKQPYDAVEIFS